MTDLGRLKDGMGSNRLYFFFLLLLQPIGTCLLAKDILHKRRQHESAGSMEYI